jgi:alcohol dehydrogenase class IV
MTKPFEFFNTPRIVFGRGEVQRVGEIVSKLGRSCLAVFNGGEPGGGGAVDRVCDALGATGVRTHLFRQRGEPTVADVERGVAAAREAGCDVLVGVGGGSAIDAAKAVAGILGNGGAALDYMEVIGKGRPITKPALAWVAVPTTAGTGAEVTRNAVLGDPARHFKASLRSELLLPRVALVDPELGVNVPAGVTASSGMDALCQLIESYTSLNAQPVTDVLAIKGIELAARSLRRAVIDGGDLNAREDMALAALWSGITLTNAGLGAVHGFAAPLGANFPVPHGTVCAALLPHVMAANVATMRAQAPGHPVLARYADIGRIVGDHPGPDEPAMEAGIDAVAALVADLNIPSLRQFGLTPAQVPEMVALARKSSSMRYNPVVLSDDALAETLTRAI